MAARTVYWMNVSLDLRIERSEGEDGDAPWARIDEELHREFNALARGLALQVNGRRTYEVMERAWPAIATDASQPAVFREYGEIWTDSPKVLVSRTRTSASHRTRVVHSIDELVEVLAATEGLVGVGGATLATQLLERGLLDELLLFTHPVVLGEGRPLFDRVAAPIQGELVEQGSFDSGVVMLRYALS